MVRSGGRVGSTTHRTVRLGARPSTSYGSRSQPDTPSSATETPWPRAWSYYSSDRPRWAPQDHVRTPPICRWSAQSCQELLGPGKPRVGSERSMPQPATEWRRPARRVGSGAASTTQHLAFCIASNTDSSDTPKSSSAGTVQTSHSASATPLLSPSPIQPERRSTRTPADSFQRQLGHGMAHRFDGQLSGRRPEQVAEPAFVLIRAVSPGQGSNLRPTLYKSGALPAELPGPDRRECARTASAIPGKEFTQCSGRGCWWRYI